MTPQEKNRLLKQMVESLETASKCAVFLIEAVPGPDTDYDEAAKDFAVPVSVRDAAAEITLMFSPYAPRRDIFPALRRLYERAYEVGSGRIPTERLYSVRSKDHSPPVGGPVPTIKPETTAVCVYCGGSHASENCGWRLPTAFDQVGD